MGKINDFFIGGRNFKEEFRRQMRLLVVVTFGFTIAFSWRQTIFDAVQTAVKKLTNTNGLSLSLLTSLTITLTSIIIIYLVSQLLKERKND